ncbi:MAG: hypothetical protein F4153_10330, partial [Acidimicrobiia bacterium]|nr:hypothetical protein [Acidimicrobiia bacterium]
MTQLAEELTNWAKTLPGWQRHVLQRLAEGESMSRPQHHSIAELLLNGEDFADAKFITPTSLPSTPSVPVTLLEVCATSNVNAISSSENLKFSSEGLTIIFGDNGSGKSGYARILKKVSGARHQEDILSDVFESNSSVPITADLAVSIGGQSP